MDLGTDYEVAYIYIYQSPTIPFKDSFYYNQRSGGDMGPVSLSNASDSGVARICQRGAKAKEQSDGSNMWGPRSKVAELWLKSVILGHLLSFECRIVSKLDRKDLD